MKEDKRLSLYLSPKLWARLREAAFKRDMSYKELVEEALAAHLPPKRQEQASGSK